GGGARPRPGPPGRPAAPAGAGRPGGLRSPPAGPPRGARPHTAPPDSPAGPRPHTAPPRDSWTAPEPRDPGPAGMRGVTPASREGWPAIADYWPDAPQRMGPPADLHEEPGAAPTRIGAPWQESRAASA